MTERERFDTWYAAKYEDVVGDGRGDLWEGWQARADLSKPGDKKLLDFFNKHALGSLEAPSCLVCGKSTQGKEVAIRHMELPNIVVCSECRGAALEVRIAQGVAVESSRYGKPVQCQSGDQTHES